MERRINKIVWLILFTLPAVIAYIILGNSAESFTFSPVHIFAIFMNGWSERVINGIPSNPMAVSFSTVFVSLLILIGWFKVINPKVRDHRLKLIVEKKFNKLDYLLGWVKYAMYGAMVVYVGILFNEWKGIAFFLSASVIHKVYIDMKDWLGWD